MNKAEFMELLKKAAEQYAEQRKAFVEKIKAKKEEEV